MCALEAVKCEKQWQQAKKNKTGFAGIFSFFCLSHLTPSVTQKIIFVSCVFPLTGQENRETAHKLAWYLCAHHSQHCDLVLQQMKTDYGNIIRIVLPFKDQITANAVCRQLRDLNVYVVVQFYPWFKFTFLLFQTHHHVIIIHYHTQKQKKRKFEPRIKSNHNIYINLDNRERARARNK